LPDSFVRPEIFEVGHGNKFWVDHSLQLLWLDGSAENAGVENAVVEIWAWYCRGGKCKSWKIWSKG